MKELKLLIVMIFLTPLLCFSQKEEKDVMSYLAGSKYKPWVFDKFKIIMGSSNTCKQGKMYTFFTNKTVEYKECIDGKWRKVMYKYALKKESPFDWWITFNNQKYYLVMKKKSQYHELTLRIINNKTKRTEHTENIILKYLLDD